MSDCILLFFVDVIINAYPNPDPDLANLCE